MRHVAWIALLASGCQLVAPLPEITGGGDGGSGSGGSVTSATSISTSATQGSGPFTSSSGSGNGCADPSCTGYCDAVVDICADHPQYPSHATCCEACSILGASAMSCRALPGPQVDAGTCTAAGVIGPMGGAQCGGCAAVCALFAHACGSSQASAVQACATHCGGGMLPFDACAQLAMSDEIGCRLQDVFRALDATGGDLGEACKDAAEHKCVSHPCGG
jgi:hypothetical protein